MNISRRPIDIIKEAKNNNAPNFRKVNKGCCYHCRRMQTNLENWYCIKHSIIFGSAIRSDVYAIANQAEFICDDFKEME